jgi:hypothetical protein
MPVTSEGISSIDPSLGRNNARRDYFDFEKRRA